MLAPITNQVHDLSSLTNSQWLTENWALTGSKFESFRDLNFYHFSVSTEIWPFFEFCQSELHQTDFVSAAPVLVSLPPTVSSVCF